MFLIMYYLGKKYMNIEKYFLKVLLRRIFILVDLSKH